MLAAPEMLPLPAVGYFRGRHVWDEDAVQSWIDAANQPPAEAAPSVGAGSSSNARAPICLAWTGNSSCLPSCRPRPRSPQPGPNPTRSCRSWPALALEVIGAQAAAVELAAGDEIVHDHVLGSVTPHRLAAPLVHDGKPVGTLSVYADHPQAFTAADSETLTLLAGAVAAHLAHASAQAPTRQRTWDDALTGLGNRHAYERRIAHECARRGRDGGLLTPRAGRSRRRSRATACVVPWPPCCSAGRGRSTASTGSARTGSR